MAARARSLVVLPLCLLMPALALAQTAAPPPPPPTGTPAPPPATGSATGSATATPPAGPVQGYGWGGPRTPTEPVHHYYAPAGPTAVLPGFESLADGSSRFFVQLTKSVAVEEHRAPGTITYILKGAHVNVFNNERPLVTVHFNTPVWRARLVPRGADLHFILELRANVTPSFKMNALQNGTALLEIDLPAGQFLASDMPELPPPGVTTTTTPSTPGAVTPPR